MRKDQIIENADPGFFAQIVIESIGISVEC